MLSEPEAWRAPRPPLPALSRRSPWLAVALAKAAWRRRNPPSIVPHFKLLVSTTPLYNFRHDPPMLHRLAREDVRTSLLSCRIAREGFRSSSAKEDRQSGCESFPCVSQTEAENEFIEHAKAIRLHPDRNDRRHAHHRHTDSAFYGRCYKRLRSRPENAS